MNHPFDMHFDRFGLTFELNDGKDNKIHGRLPGEEALIPRAWQHVCVRYSGGQSNSSVTILVRGIKGGVTHGETDDFGYNIVKDGVHIRDLNATILNRLGIDSQRFTVKHRGLDERLTGVQAEARPIRELFV
jgi:hypothetical protein